MDKKNFSRLFISICFIAFLFGCVATKPVKPNNPYQGLYPVEFNKISDKNPLLAEEIGKLPELQDGISEKENVALLQLVRLYEKHPSEFDDAFDEMYKTGLPDIRKYCTPLQALFWLAEDNILKEELIVNYVLPVLLNSSWKKKKRLTKIQILDLIEDLKSEDLKKKLSGLIKNGFKKDAIRIIMEKYKNNSSLFSKSALKKIRNYNLSDPRWSDADVIIDRLNSPQLLGYWLSRNFSYDWSKFRIYRLTAYPQSAEKSIRTKKGICFDAAYLAYKCLKQAGYDATGLNVYFGTRTRIGAIMHSVCVIKKEELKKITYYKLADTRSLGLIDGPYDSVKSIAESIASMHRVPLGNYFTGIPSYDYNFF